MRRCWVSTVGLLALALSLAACSGDSDSDSAGASGNCIITFTGDKLCGADGKAWCEQFAERVSTDAETRLACSSVGADLAASEVSESGPIAIATQMDSELGGKYDELDISASPEDSGGYTISVQDFAQEPVPQKTKRRICKSARAVTGVGNGPLTILDLNGSDYECPSRGALGVE